MHSNIPAGWKKIKLNELVTLEYGKGLTNKDRKAGNVPVYGSSGIVGYHDQPLIKGKGVIIGRKGQVGAVHFSKTSFWPIDTVFFIRESSRYDIRFVYYLLKYVNLPRLTGDSAVPGLKREIVYQEEVIVPTIISEQCKIAEILGSLDDKIELNYEMNKTLEAIAQAIFKNWFVDFEPFKDELVYNEELGKEIPRGWEVVKLGDVAKIESGGNAPQGEEYFINGIYPFVRVKHLTDSPVVGGSDLINKKAIEDYRLRLFKKGSIVFAKSGEAIKAERINMLPFDAFIVNHLAIISKATVSLWFIYFYIRELIHKLVIEQGGTALPYLRISDIEREILLKPPSSVIEAFHSSTDPIFQNIFLNYQENKTLEQIRDSLLPKLLSGEIRVKVDIEKEFPEEIKKLEEIEKEKTKINKTLKSG